MKIEEKALEQWSAPQLLRLNQIDGTEKHLYETEQGGNCRITVAPLDAPSGGVDNSGVCGPS